MKLICNKEEFAALIRSCMSGNAFDQCCGCAFTPFCSQYSDMEDDDYMSSIEDICELSSEE